MKKAIVVIGAGFGDEGKGRTVANQSLNLRSQDSICVRWAGGANAGHTVEYEGKKHVFSHFSAGMVNGLDTFLAKDFIVNPMLFIKELQELKTFITCSIMNTPRVFVHQDCLVTTPTEMFVNRTLEDIRSKNKTNFGSVGIGINETFHKNIGCDDKRTVKYFLDRIHLFKEDSYFKNFIENEIKYIKERIKRESIEIQIEFNIRLEQNFYDGIYKTFIQNLEQMFSMIFIESDYNILKNKKTVVFEGHQGLLLDKDHKFYPHVTNAYTGSTSLIPILKEIEFDEIDINYILRGYMTRHGNGDFPSVIGSLSFEDLTNQPNKYQGAMRFGALDLPLIKQAVDKDIMLLQNHNIKTNITLVINNINQIIDKSFYFVYEDGSIKNLQDVTTMLLYIKRYLGFINAKFSQTKNFKDPLEEV